MLTVVRGSSDSWPDLHVGGHSNQWGAISPGTLDILYQAFDTYESQLYITWTPIYGYHLSNRSQQSTHLLHNDVL